MNCNIYPSYFFKALFGNRPLKTFTIGLQVLQILQMSYYLVVAEADPQHIV